jgi:hypothetical protein
MYKDPYTAVYEGEVIFDYLIFYMKPKKITSPQLIELPGFAMMLGLPLNSTKEDIENKIMKILYKCELPKGYGI